MQWRCTTARAIHSGGRAADINGAVIRQTRRIYRTGYMDRQSISATLQCDRSWALPIDLAELLFQFGDQFVEAFPRQVIRRPRELAGFHDLHFEFYTLVFRGHLRTPSFIKTLEWQNCSIQTQEPDCPGSPESQPVALDFKGSLVAWTAKISNRCGPAAQVCPR
jgi:hypothetical protein